MSSRPAVFSDGVITLQQIRACQPVFSAALTGYIEATRGDDARKNLICPANQHPDTAADWVPLIYTAQRAEMIWATDPDVSAWMQRSRLNGTRGIGDHQGDPLMEFSARPPVHQHRARDQQAGNAHGRHRRRKQCGLISLARHPVCLAGDCIQDSEFAGRALPRLATELLQTVVLSWERR